MVTKWKKWASLLSLVLAVELLAAGLAGGVLGLWILQPRGYGPGEVFRSDYRDTAAFRDKISNILYTFLDFAAEDPSGKGWRSTYQDDPNLLYRVVTTFPASKRTAVITNTSAAGGELWAPPGGYQFQLTYLGGNVSIRMGETNLDVYGGGLYTPDSLWDVPGYTNRPATAPQKSVTVYLAVSDRPVQTFDYSPIYDVYRTITAARRLYLADLAVLALGLLFLALAVLWRRERREVRLALARRTGRVWFEVKALFVAGLPLFFLWGLMRGVWFPYPRLSAGVFAALYPWVLYLAANDLRHNEKPWRQSLLYKALQWTGRPTVADFYGKLWFEGKLLLLLGVSVLAYKLLDNLYWFYGYETVCALLAVALLVLCLLLLLVLSIKELLHSKKPWRNSLCGQALRWAKNPEVLDRTGRIWFEVKLLVLLLPLCAAPYLLRYHLYYTPQWIAAAAGGLLYLWLLYLAVSDLRHNKKPWRNSLCAGLLRRMKAGLAAAEAMLPMQRRFFWRGAVAAACVLILAALALGVLMAWFTPLYYRGSQALLRLLLAVLPVGCLLTPIGWYLVKTRDLLRELAPLTDQLSALRAGALATPLAFPEGSDLAQAAEDLNGIQQGMRSALEERMRSERMKVELIANVSHDLKTPLTSVISYAELLREEEDLPRHVQDYIRILSAKAKRLQVMVQDVFEVSKAASGELSVRTERLDLAKLLRQTLADMDEPIRESTLAFRTALPSQPVWITADGDRLYRVFQNLIQNALQYALEGSRVYVTLEVREGAALAAVKNTSRDELPPNADFTARFVRGDSSRSDGGSGLGLAIASSFAAACGGSLRVETDADLFTAVVAFPSVN